MMPGMTAYARLLLAILTLSAALAAQTPCAWSALGTGMTVSAGDRIETMALFDDGSGLALYVAGGFTNISGTPANSVARWNGTSWTAVGAGLVGFVNDLCVFDDGTGPALYAAGSFGGFGVSRWTGTAWVPVSGGATPAVPTAALAAFDDGSGSALYATTYNGLAPLKIVRWNGATWTPVGTGTMAGVGWTLEVIDDGSGPALYAGGSFAAIGGVPASNLARWDGTAWSAVGGSSPVLEVRAITRFDDGTGPALYVGGLGNAPMNGIARWDGTTWNPLGSGLGPVPVNFPPFFVQPTARALAAFDDGGGPALFVGGMFPTAGGVAAPGLARWNGGGWSANGGTETFALEVFDDGSGPALFAGGHTSSQFGVNAQGIARFGCNGSPSLTASQNGPGLPLFIGNANLQAGSEYYNLFSLDVCGGGPGSGPPAYFGLCATSSANLAFLWQQVLLPVGSPPFHFVAPTSYAIWGPYFVAPITVDALCIEVTPAGIVSNSPVLRLIVQ
jgi:hypothetical protein